MCWILNKHITRYPLLRSRNEISPLTHTGLFTFKRLPNGISSGPAIFQRIMDNLLYDVPKAVSRLDDILVAGSDEEYHLRTLSLVLERLLAVGFRLNEAKCKFLQECVSYLGHTFDGEGLHPTEDKLDAIRDAPRPKDVTALKFFVGLIMFYSQFMPHHSIILAPLHNLLKKDTSWKWSRVCCCKRAEDTELTNTGALSFM